MTDEFVRERGGGGKGVGLGWNQEVRDGDGLTASNPKSSVLKTDLVRRVHDGDNLTVLEALARKETLSPACRIPWKIPINEPGQVGTIRTHSCTARRILPVYAQSGRAAAP